VTAFWDIPPCNRRPDDGGSTPEPLVYLQITRRYIPENCRVRSLILLSLHYIMPQSSCTVRENEFNLSRLINSGSLK
jgi:hypothetical protein